MIYWRAERNSLCIHSQLESPSSSEVASTLSSTSRAEFEQDWRKTTQKIAA